jgi:hypothetical protein
VAQIMDAHVVEIGGSAYAAPRMLKIVQMRAPAIVMIVPGQPERGSYPLIRRPRIQFMSD